MFDGPEHASYIALMRELRLERPIGHGDWFWWPGGDEHDAGAYCYNGFATGEGMAPDPRRGGVPLPLLHDWLAKLEEADIRRLTIQWLPPDENHATWTWALTGRAHLGVGLTREEAAARLWCAVTGRTIPATP